MTGWLLSKEDDLIPKGFSRAFGKQMVPVRVVAEITLFMIRQQWEVKCKQRMSCHVITLSQRYSEEHKQWWLSESAWAARQKITDWVLKQQRCISHSYGGWSCKIKVRTALVSPGLQAKPQVFNDTSSVASHCVLTWCSGVSFSSHKYTSSVRLVLEAYHLI